MSKTKKTSGKEPAGSRKLIAAAKKAREKAYCPYSRYAVGSAVLAGSGRVYPGCNVENASLGLACCAERVAIFNAVAAGEKKIVSICIAAEEAYPCGACRQVISEFGPKAEVILVHLNGGKERLERFSEEQMLPHAFTPRFNPRNSGIFKKSR